MKKTVITNLYPGVLWDTWVMDKNIKSNLYKKEVEIDEKFTHLKSDLNESNLSRVTPVEYLIMKYLPIVIGMYLIFSVNLYYPSMLGMMVASILYPTYYIFKNKFNAFFANLFLMVLLIVFIISYVQNYSYFSELKIGAIVNYSFQYLIMLYLLERVFINIAIEDTKGWKKIDSLTLRYVKIFNKDKAASDEIKKKTYRKWYFGFLGFIAVITFILGGVEFYNKYRLHQKAQEIASSEIKQEKKVLRIKNSKVMKYRLENQAKKFGFTLPKKDVELLENDFEKYVETRPIAYEIVRLTRGNEIVRARDGVKVNIDFSRKKHLTTLTFVQKYKGEYRWHFRYNKETCVVVNSVARSSR